MVERIEQKKEILVTAQEYIAKLEPGLNTSIEFFREGEDAQALNILNNALEGISWLLDTFEVTKDIQSEKIEDYGIKSKLEEMEVALNDIDYIMLSDLIEYEIIPIVQKWRTQLGDVVNM